MAEAVRPKAEQEYYRPEAGDGSDNYLNIRRPTKYMSKLLITKNVSF